MEAHEAGRMGRLKRVMMRRIRDSMVVTHALSWGHGYGRDARCQPPQAAERADSGWRVVLRPRLVTMSFEFPMG